MSAILKFDFQKREQLRSFWSKLSKLHKKDPILHVTTTFSLKQGETRTNSVPIPHLLKLVNNIIQCKGTKVLFSVVRSIHLNSYFSNVYNINRRYIYNKNLKKIPFLRLFATILLLPLSVAYN